MSTSNWSPYDEFWCLRVSVCKLLPFKKTCQLIKKTNKTQTHKQKPQTVISQTWKNCSYNLKTANISSKLQVLDNQKAKKSPPFGVCPDLGLILRDPFVPQNFFSSTSTLDQETTDPLFSSISHILPILNPEAASLLQQSNGKPEARSWGLSSRCASDYKQPDSVSKLSDQI